MRESRLKQRNFELILFFESARVKENRELPLCKKKSDDGSSQGTVRHLGEKHGCWSPDFPGAIQFLGFLVQPSFR